MDILLIGGTGNISLSVTYTAKLKFHGGIYTYSNRTVVIIP